jgi:hypothetical protein
VHNAVQEVEQKAARFSECNPTSRCGCRMDAGPACIGGFARAKAWSDFDRPRRAIGAGRVAPEPMALCL